VKLRVLLQAIFWQALSTPANVIATAHFTMAVPLQLMDMHNAP
jgi:hypothetical protein